MGGLKHGSLLLAAALLLAACSSSPASAPPPGPDGGAGGGEDAGVPGADGGADAPDASSPAEDAALLGDVHEDAAPPEDATPEEDATPAEDATPEEDATPDVPACEDGDGDGVCDEDDPCPLDNPDDEDLNGVCDADDRARCEASQRPALTWLDASSQVALPGAVALGQTHIDGPGETRIRPRHVASRDTLLLFTPDAPLPSGTALRVIARRGDEALGVLPLQPPEAPLPLLEQRLTETPLEAPAQGAWRVVLPWSWIAEGVRLEVAYIDEDGVRHALEHTLSALGAPHLLTISRNKIVLFGEDDFDTTTTPLDKLARDFAPALPVSQLRQLDAAPWRLSYIIARTPDGPRRAESEEELQAISDDDHYFFLKNHLALRVSLANTGRGLALLRPQDGDSSPYSYGTAVALGWYRDVDGTYADMDDAGVAGGWTGWSAIWSDRGSECGNAWIHEIGHSFTLAHFTEGTADAWGIADEYPQDGVQLPTHPTSFHTLERAARAWYRVDATGPVLLDDQTPRPRRDPMNGGEPADATSCFPAYTAYHTRKAQEWFQDTPTLRRVDGQSGLFRWDPSTSAYTPAPVAPAFQAPLEVDVEVVTLIGTLGNADEANQLYPPLFSPLGNVFELPDPRDPTLSSAYLGAVWFLEIDYADGTTERALIQRGPITDTNLSIFSLNLPLEREPVEARLMLSPSPYPQIDTQGARLAATLPIPAPPDLDPVVYVGRGQQGHGALRLTDRCDEGFNCQQRAVEAAWRGLDAPLTFQHPSAPAAPSTCLPEGAFTTLTLPITHATTGDLDTLTVYAQRTEGEPGDAIAVPLHDQTPWRQGPDTRQSLRLWAPLHLNDHLLPGRWVLAAPQHLSAALQGAPWARIDLEVDLTVYEPLAAPLEQAFDTPAFTLASSGAFFVAQDPRVGPTEGVWWGADAPTLLNVPVLDEATQEPRTLRVAAWQVSSCGGRWQMNAGRGAGDCQHHVTLQARPQDNPDLPPGRAFITPPSAPLLLEAWRWHTPRLRLDTLALELRYTSP